jgi:hypothetical protein
VPVAKAKRRKYSPKEEAEEREYGFRRIVGHSEIVGYNTHIDGDKVIKMPIWSSVGGILELKRPTNSDLWWARKFLRTVLANPLHPVETMSAANLLQRLDDKWPEPKPKKVVKQPVKQRKLKQAHVLILQSALRGVRKKLKVAKTSLDYWTPRFNNMALSNPKWGDMRQKVNLLRQEVDQYKVRVSNLKERLK